MTRELDKAARDLAEVLCDQNKRYNEPEVARCLKVFAMAIDLEVTQAFQKNVII